MRTEQMERFEYDVTKHGNEAFTRLIYFCSTSGECNIEHVPAHEPQALVNILNGRGEDGWELLQISFGKDGLIAFWKRRVYQD
jgi:hypothetical protein